jgi:hypothetical protein
MATAPRVSTPLTELAEPDRRRALENFRQLRPHLEQDAPLAPIANEVAVSLRTAQRWVRRYRECGVAGLIRTGRADRGTRRRLQDELRQLAEGLAPHRGRLLVQPPSTANCVEWPVAMRRFCLLCASKARFGRQNED